MTDPAPLPALGICLEVRGSTIPGQEPGPRPGSESVIAGSRPGLIRLRRPAVTHEMVRVNLEHRPLTATAALVWSGDLPRTLQQILFDTAESITSPGPARQVEPELKAMSLSAAHLGQALSARAHGSDPRRHTA